MGFSAAVGRLGGIIDFGPPKSETLSVVTTRDIARELGISHVTVAAALKGGRKCSQATRDRVLETARRMGWRPNPLVLAFQEAVASGRVRDTREGIAWIFDGPAGSSLWQVEVCLAAAKERAAQWGFSINEFRLSDYGFGTGASAEEAMESVLRVVRARGIRAVIVPLREHLVLNRVASLEKDDLSMVLLLDDGAPVMSARDRGTWEGYHRVTTDFFANTQLALGELAKLGYRRIGLCLSDWRNHSTAGAIPAAYQVVRWEFERSAPFFVAAPPPERPLRGFARWLEKGRFDAILCGNTQIKSWLEEIGCRIPEEIGLAHFELGPAETGWSGIDARLTAVSASTVDLVTAHLLRNETGRPKFTKVLRVEGIWIAGNTTRSVSVLEKIATGSKNVIRKLPDSTPAY